MFKEKIIPELFQNKDLAFLFYDLPDSMKGYTIKHLVILIEELYSWSKSTYLSEIYDIEIPLVVI